MNAEDLLGVINSLPSTKFEELGRCLTTSNVDGVPCSANQPARVLE